MQSGKDVSGENRTLNRGNRTLNAEGRTLNHNSHYTKGRDMNMRIGRTVRERVATSRLPECRFEREECHAYKDGCCQALSDTDFGDGDCPFYRSKEENVREVSACINILIRKGRTDLIDKYRPVYNALSLLGDEDEFIKEARRRLLAKNLEVRAEVRTRKESVRMGGGTWYE